MFTEMILKRNFFFKIFFKSNFFFKKINIVKKI